MTRLRAEIAPGGGVLARAVSNARSRWAARHGLVLRLFDGSGAIGQGEASPLPDFSSDDLESARAALQAFADEPLEIDLERPVDALLAEVARLLPAGQAGACFAVETALLDLIGQRQRKPVWTLLRSVSRTRDPAPAPLPLSALVDATSEGLALREAEAAIERGIRTLKLKLGRPGEAASELRTALALRAAFGSTVRLRFDANRAWPPGDATLRLKELALADPEFVEEALEPAALAAAGRLPVPLALDESLLGADWLDRKGPELLQAGVTAVVLKPMLLGGFGTCLRLAARARARASSGCVTPVRRSDRAGRHGRVRARCGERRLRFGIGSTRGARVLAEHTAADDLALRGARLRRPRSWPVAARGCRAVTLSIFAAARDARDRCAVATPEETLSFAELAERVGRASSWLRERGITAPAPGAPLRPVALVARADLATLELLHALIALGAPVLPVHPRLVPKEREQLLAECGSGELLDWNAERERQHSRLEDPPVPDDERCLAVVQTSGSSGRPRSAILSRRAFATSAVASAQNLGWRDDDRWLIHLPLSHVGGLSIVTRCLMARRAVVIAPPRDNFDPAELSEIIARERVTLLSLVPTQLIRLLDLEPAWRPPPPLRALLLGGAAASNELIERAAARGVPVLTTYGLTEACSQVATQKPGTRLAAGAIGPPLPGVEARIKGGEIQVRGATLMTGYHPAAASPFDSDGWLGTGDLGRFDAEGNLHVIGRLRELIISGGENVNPREVEELLERLPGVRSACVFGVADPSWGELVAAAVVPAQPGAVDLSSLETHLRRELATFKRPRRIALVDELPLLPSGKLDRVEVAKVALPLLRPVESYRQNP